MDNVKRFFSHIFAPARPLPASSVEALQQNTLNLLIWGIGGACLILRFALLLMGDPGRKLMYPAMDIFLVGIVVILLTERFIPYWITSFTFILYLIGMLFISDTLPQVLLGESLIFFIFPIAIAGLLLRPWAGYVAAGIISVVNVIIVISLQLGIVPVVHYMLFFLVAFVIQISTSRLTRAMKEYEKKGRELQESEEKYRRLIDLLPVGVLIHQDQKIVLANPTFLKYAGAQSLEDFKEKVLADLVHPDTRLAAQQRARAAMDEGLTTSLREEKFFRLDGSTFYAEISRTPFVYNWRPAMLVMINDINERKKFHEAITLKNRRIQEMSRRVLEIQEQERHLLAAELHDDLGQSLTSLKLMLELSSRARSTTIRQKRTAEARELVVELMNKVRNLSLDLRPAVLDDFGLFPALRWLYDRYKSQTGIRVICNYDQNCDRRFEPPVETTAFRIIQEALTNVARHALVAEARVTISMDDPLTLEVADAGVGFNVEQVTRDTARSTGLSGMQERARLVGGSLEIISSPEAGTRILARIPLEAVRL